jgi:hypothetical protein
LVDPDCGSGKANGAFFCAVSIKGKPHNKFQTEVLSDHIEPVWNYRGELDLTPGDHMLIRVYDRDPEKGDQLLGEAIVTSDVIACGTFLRQRELMLARSGRTVKAFVTIQIADGDEASGGVSPLSATTASPPDTSRPATAFAQVEGPLVAADPSKTRDKRACLAAWARPWRKSDEEPAASPIAGVVAPCSEVIQSPSDAVSNELARLREEIAACHEELAQQAA